MKASSYAILLLTATALHVVGIETANASINCSKNWVCVEAVESPQQVEFYLENRKPYPVTISFHARTRNLTASNKNPITVTLSGGGRELINRFSVTNRAKDWYYRYYYDWAVGSLNVQHDEDYLYRLPYA
ncbi:MAG: hypothetical protein MJA83_03095, partial [Gammaproteobacteria bacterium]|nr:hypothetical protein [Gammaproteobacteria bacterium]